MNPQHHAFVIEAEADEGVAVAEAWVEKELGMKIAANPDVILLRYGLLSVADARRVIELAAGAPFAGETKAVIIVANRAYHEAQNALLKVFEEPPTGTYLFLILPTLGGLLPTLRSRVQILSAMWDIGSPTCNVGLPMSHIPEIAQEFLKATKEKRTTLIKRLSSGKDEEERREHRALAISLINGIEAAAYTPKKYDEKIIALLSDIATLRSHLYDRSAPVRMILEHLSLVISKDLV